MKPVRLFVFQLDQGWGGASATEDGLTALIGPYQTQQEAETELNKAAAHEAPRIDCLQGKKMNEESLKMLAAELNEYYQGKAVSLDFPVDWAETGVTDFQRQALEACKEVPYGEAATYGDLAKRIGRPKACRAIGGAMHINPVFPVVP